MDCFQFSFYSPQYITAPNLIMQKMKKCWKCKKKKCASYFHVNNSRKDKLQTMCKVCQTIINRSSYYKNRRRDIKRNIINRRGRGLLNYIKVITEYLNVPCADCGVLYHPASMVFDHISSKEKLRIRKTEGVNLLVREGYSWKVVKNEIGKCEVRCQNCHFLKTSKDFNYWKEISNYIKDYSKLIKKLYEYHGNFSESDAFKKQKQEISDKFAEAMSQHSIATTKKKREKLKKEYKGVSK